MYEQTFQFSSRPFNSVPRLEDFFAGLSYQQAIDVAHMCVDRSTGPVVVVGSVGMGKSLLLQKLGQSFDSRFDVVHIECSRLEERSELLQSILFELNLPYTGLSEGELRLSLMGYLKESKGADDGVLLLVDEADRLSIELIDELRLITNQIRDGRSLVQLVLAGTQRLEDSLTDAKLASFNQRIAARCVLQNLSKTETEQFIYQHIERAGRNGREIFDGEATAEVHQSTDGVPRLINQLCDQSLLLAASRELQSVDRSLIREAWAEMQNMPLASLDTCSKVADRIADSGSVVEFGQLGGQEADSEFVDGSAVAKAEDPFAPQPFEGAGEQAEHVGHDEGVPSAEHVAEDNDEATDSVPVESTSLGIHASAAALATAAFAATAASSDPFAPQENDQRLDDGNTESERIASLEQEQDELLEQTRGHDEAASDEVRSAFEVLGLSEQGVEPVDVDEMIPADPFQLPEEAGDSVDSVEETNPTYAVQQTEEAVGAYVDDSPREEDLSPMAQCSIEEQLGLVESDEPVAAEPASFHTPVYEPRPFVESDSLENQTDDLTQGEAANSTDPFSEPFEEEEMLQDAYSPFVAEQNQASLGVTSNQLSHLTPLDAVSDASDDNGSDQWNSQTPELAIEELDATGVSTDSAPSDVESIGEGDFISNDGPQASDGFSPTHSSAPPTDVWQNNRETAWDPSQYQVPSEVDSQTPASFQPIPSVATELGPVVPSSGPLPHEQSAFNEDPFAPKEDLGPAQPEAVYPQSQGEQPTDEDLEALTSDLGSAATFDLDSQHNGVNGGVVESEEPAAGRTGGMMDLNDLVPGHLLHQMEANKTDQFSSSAPYSTHASVYDAQTPEAAAQAEARRKTEEFMRNFNAQRDVEVSDDTGLIQSFEQPTASEDLVQQPEEKSQEILKEIFSQQQILDNVHFTDPPSATVDQSVASAPENYQSHDGQGADSYSVETPVTEFQNYQQAGEPPVAQDDRDMLYVNETQQYAPPQAAEAPQPPPFPNVETSTGNAERMDYNQLFDQLRNSSPEQ